MRAQPVLRSTAVAIAILAALPAAAAAAPDTRITFYFGLERPETAARAAFFAVGDPASSSFRHFRTADGVARRYGADGATRRGFRAAAERRGFAVRIDRSRVFARVTGTVALFGQVFGRHIRKEFNNDEFANAYFPRGGHRLRLPADLKPYVRDVVASYSRSTPTASGGGGATAAAAAARKGPRNRGTWRGGCRKAKATGGYSYPQVRHAYGVDAVGTGAGASVAILNVGEGLTRRDRRTYARCFGLRPVRTRTLLTDGQARPFGRGTFEPQEDFALVRGMAPGLRSITFTQVWLATELWFLGPAQVFSAPGLPRALSMSYGECERDVRGHGSSANERAGARLMDAMLVRLGLAGVGSFASAGDFGSTCNGQLVPGVAWPASSPFLTAVGGSRLVLDSANERVREVVWNDLRWESADNGGGAGGGGFARHSRRPPYQRAVIGGRRRAVPDVAAHASMFPAWPVDLGKFWVSDGGTSAAAPLVAGAWATVSARAHAPLGPANGLLYALGDAAAYDVTHGDNGYDRHVPAHRARPGYDLASGLGVPDFGALARVAY
jgi:Pro-kumamolisin, activation domain